MRSPLQNSIVVALAAGAALWPSPAPAQVEVAPALGLYWPVGEWIQQSDGGTGFAPRRKQLKAAVAGGRLTVWVSERLALQGAFAFAPSQVAVSTIDGTTDVTAGLYLTSAQALFRVATLNDGRPDDPVSWDLLLGAGAGLVHRTGSAWDNTTGVTAPAIALTAAVGTGLGRGARLRLALEDFISWAQFDAGQPSETRARLHHDMNASLGVVVRVGGR